MRKEAVDVELDIGEEIHLVQHDEVTRSEHVRIFHGLILPLGHRGDDHPRFFAQVEERGANEITDVLDEDERCRGRVESPQGTPEHLRI